MTVKQRLKAGIFGAVFGIAGMVALPPFMYVGSALIEPYSKWWHYWFSFI